MKKHLSILVLAVAAAMPCASALAQFKPTRTIEVVVHTGPGGGADVLGRFISNLVEKEKLAPVRMQINNKTGGGGATAMNYVVEKKGDPHTIALFTGVWLTNPLTQAESKVTIKDMDGKPRVVKACELSGADNVLFRRNSVTGAIEAVPWQGEGIALNAALHAN